MTYENLILLFYPHHGETDDIGTDPVERLLGMKATRMQCRGWARRPRFATKAFEFKTGIN